MIDRSTETVNMPYLKGKSKHTEFPPGIFEKIKGNSTYFYGKGKVTLPSPLTWPIILLKLSSRGKSQNTEFPPGIFEKIKGNST